VEDSSCISREVLVGLEVRIGLGDGDEAAECLGEHALGGRLLRGALAGSHRRAARLHDVLERAPLVRGIPLDGLDEVADEVMATGELDVDLTPRLLHQVAQLDEAVVDPDGPQDEQQDDDDDDDQGDDHWVPPPVR
jgi:hypothetical protein